jgi:hypothetical protein
MATNREMLKEAIADAKAVKETAIANAKAALEEAFAPQLKSMLSMKLQEMEEVEEMEDKMYEMEDKKSMEEVEDDMTNEIDLEELLAELELEEGDMEGLNEAEEEEEEDMEMSDEESEEGEEEGEPIELEDMTDEDLKDMIEDVIKDMIESGELEAGHEGGEGEEEGEESEEGEEEEIDLAELLREIEEMDKPVDEAFGIFKKDPAKKMASAAKEFDGFVKSEIASREIPEMVKEFGNLSPNDPKYMELIVKYLDHPKFTTAAGNYMSSIGKTTSGAKYLAYFRDIFGKEVFTTPAYGPEGRGGANVDETMKAELDEAYSTIEALKSELNEINLLNAKLLYTNKIFKAKNLNESQKVKVLSSFDKAKNVGEVKMVFETLNEGIKVSKNTIKENLGSASKGTMTPSIKKPIVESNEAFLRMQKLAGII